MRGLGWVWVLLAVVGCDDGGASSVDAGLDSGAGEVDARADDADVAAVDAGADAQVTDAQIADAMGDPHPGLRDPSLADETAPDTFAVRFETTAGDYVVDVTRAWAPRGADRFYTLVRIGFYNDVAYFRVLDGFMAQTGLNGDPAVTEVWNRKAIEDDPVAETNSRGRLTFATAGPNTRTTQVFFNFGANGFLDDQGFAPFGEVRDMTTLDALYNGYGEGAPNGMGPDQGRIQTEGNVYLRGSFPELDYIVRASITE
ncbi:MAG: peptidyl-prolyl cis-trans isomerase A (cyclophilin A) [Bradymonadia bacterium]|jgi:peptidyl-prolyl cis-trans isomerase A (cyclophilin A)